MTFKGTWTKEKDEFQWYTVVYEWDGDVPAEAELPVDEEEYLGPDAAKEAVDTTYTGETEVTDDEGYIHSFSGWDAGTVNQNERTVTFYGEWTSEKDPGQWYTVKYEWTGAEKLTEELPVDENEYLGLKEAKAAVDTTYTADTKVKGTDKNDYTFSGWDGGTVEGQVITFAGAWTKKSSGGPSGGPDVTLTYESNGGTRYAKEGYARNVVVQLDKTPKREGYTFTGWHSDAELTDKIDEIKMTTDKTVYAGWQKSDVPPALNGDDHFAYVIGYPDGTVRPNAHITRAEVATIFFRLLDADVREENLSTENDFNDVTEDDWFNTAVSTLAKLGIIGGYSDGGFHPSDEITRAEFATIAGRFDSRKADKDADFSDITGHWASEEISKAARNGWIDGYTDGSFQPDAQIKRCEAMAIINRVLDRLPQSKDDLLDGMNTWPDNNESDWFYLYVQEATNSHECDHRADGSEFWTKMTEDPDWTRYQ